MAENERLREELFVCLKIKIGRREKGLVPGLSNAEGRLRESDTMQVPPFEVPELRYSLLFLARHSA